MTDSRRVPSVLAAIGLASLAACATSAPSVQDIGGGAYELTKRSGVATRRAIVLEAAVEDDALAWCKGRGGLALSVLDKRSAEDDPPDYAYATIRFRCSAP